MFGWLSGGKLKREVEQLRTENLQLKEAAGGEFITGASTGIPISSDRGHNLGLAREQLSHYNGWPFSAIRVIATRCAGQPLHVSSTSGGPRTVKADGDNLKPIDNHPLLDLIANPNPWMPAWSLIYVTVASMQLTGKAYWWLKFDEDGQPSIFLLPVNWVTPLHTNGLYSKWLVRPDGDPEGFQVDGQFIAYFSLPSPLDPLRGAVSPLSAQADAVLTDENLQRSQQAAFANGVNPGVVIKVGKLPGPDGRPMDQRRILTPMQRRQLINAIRRVYASATKNDEPFIVDGLIEEITRITTTPREMDYSSSGEITKARIMQGFGVNAISAGQVENANRASATVAQRALYQNVVNPQLVLLGQVLTLKVAPLYARGNERLTCWFEPCKADDDEISLRAWNKALDKGTVTHNEYRRRWLGLPDVPWGNETAEVSSTTPPGEKFLSPRWNPYDLKSLTNGRH